MLPWVAAAPCYLVPCSVIAYEMYGYNVWSRAAAESSNRVRICARLAATAGRGDG